MQKITIMGTGYVGLVTAIGLAELGHDITCLDCNREKIEKLQKGEVPIFEPNLPEYLHKNRERIHFMVYPEQKLAEDTTVLYMCLPTPAKENGEADVSFLEQAINQIKEELPQSFYLVIKSTVPIGTCRRIEEEINQDRLAENRVEVIANPEFLSQGTAVEDVLKGTKIIIGVSTKKAEDKMKEIYQKAKHPCFFTHLEEAELIKYASNSFLATKISFINEIANLGETCHADIEKVVKGMALDKRIGDSFFRAGIGYGGSCFPKDVQAILAKAEQNQVEMNVIKGTKKTNEKQRDRLIEKSRNYYPTLQHKTVAILRATFKPNTDDIRHSIAVYNLQKMLEEGANIQLYEPIAKNSIQSLFGDHITYVNTIEEALTNADICFIFAEWEEIRTMNLELFQTYMKNPIVLDGRNCFSLEEVKKYEFVYESIGRPTIHKRDEKVSIIMPVYNCEKYVKQTIESVKKQTYTNWELIIINDASTDQSLVNIQEAISTISDQVKLIDLPENQGVAIARNTGLAQASGRYIAYLDGDDLWLPQKLEKQLQLVKGQDCGFTYTSYYYLHENGDRIPMSGFQEKLTYRQSLKNTLILTSTVMIDRQKIDPMLLQMPNIRRGQDTATWWQILKQGYCAYGVREPLSIYRRRKDSLSFKKRIALKRTWQLYRNIEHFSRLTSVYYFSCYLIHAFLRRINIKQKKESVS